jgi:hypothetical protein
VKMHHPWFSVKFISLIKSDRYMKSSLSRCDCCVINVPRNPTVVSVSNFSNQNDLQQLTSLSLLRCPGSALEMVASGISEFLFGSASP